MVLSKLNLIFILLFYIIATHKNLFSQIDATKFNASQEINITVEDSLVISGTLKYISSNKLAIIIAGSGPTDRNCNSSLGLNTNAYKMLAKSLAENEISSFRYDKRGIGKSSRVKEGNLDFHSFVSDLEQIIQNFNSSFEEIYLIGHSEGALISTLALENSEKVKSLILISGSSLAFDEILIEQIEKYPKLVPLVKQHIKEIKTGSELSNVNPLLASMFRPSIVPFLKSAFVIDPLFEISKIDKPILIIGGSCDMQVPVYHSEELSKYNSKAKLVIIKGMGHLMKRLDEDCLNASNAYLDKSLPLNKILEESISSFIK